MAETTTTPTNDDIEAVIQMATQAAHNDPRSLPLRDTRTQLFVANLPYRVRWQDLKDLFRRAGTVLRADVSLGPDNRSRGYGTVLLATAEDAGRAVDMFSGYSWQGRILEVRADRVRDFDQPFPEAEEEYAPVGRNLFVGNWQDLKDLFRQAGTIVRADVALGPDGRSRGFGTVVFATEKDAHRAVGMFSGYEYNGRTLKVHYDKFSQGTQQPFDLGLLSSTSTSFDLGLAPEYPSDMFSMSHRLYDSTSMQQHQFQQPLPTAQASLAQLQSQLQHLQLDSLPSPVPSHAHSQSPPQPPQEHRSPEPPPSAGATETSYASAISGAKRSPTSPHPHHPGPIALPPPPALPADPQGNNSGSGIGYPPNPAAAFAPPAYALTPLGLPPITPSMPPFSFLPMPSPHQQQQQQQSYFGLGPATPTHAHFLNMTPLATPTSPHFPAYILGPANMPMPSPGVGPLGPASALSPGAFWGRAGEGTVYGAPVGQPPHQSHPSPYAHPHYGGNQSPGFFGMHAMVPVDEPKGYFDFPPALGTGGAAGGGAGARDDKGAGTRGVEREIMKGEKEKESDAARGRAVEREAEEAREKEAEAEAEEVPQVSVLPSEHPQERARRHSSDPPPPSPMREGKRPPPLRLSPAAGSG
ncbi:hypothetical protein DFH07DRAFT_219717 [Mycena maculata]|uniref:RRM domain-containing protein n=1 Tax=Mycena maculata TaxID=230809 RepID=A0AAD7MQU6_9AGAR|nr:hypothetical protein DFH07DRAFT_219717 [Mycena maculata]